MHLSELVQFSLQNTLLHASLYEFTLPQVFQ